MRNNLLIAAIFASFPLFFSQVSLAQDGHAMSDFIAAQQARQQQAAEQTAKANAADEAPQAQAVRADDSRDS